MGTVFYPKCFELKESAYQALNKYIYNKEKKKSKWFWH